MHVSNLDGLDFLKKNGWVELYQNKKFEMEKAVLSMEAVKEDFLSNDDYKSISDVFNKPSATLATIKKYQGENSMKSVLVVLLKMTVDFFNLGKGMNDKQLVSTAGLIYSEYFFLTIGDIKVCLRNAMLGKYGQLYDRIDGSIILDWFNRYNEERQGVAAVDSYNSHKRVLKRKEENKNTVPMPDYIKAKIKELESKVSIEYIEIGKIKFASFEDYLKSIGKDTERVRGRLLKHWAKDIEESDFDPNGYSLYKISQIMNMLNNGRQIPDDVLRIILNK